MEWALPLGSNRSSSVWYGDVMSRMKLYLLFCYFLYMTCFWLCMIHVFVCPSVCLSVRQSVCMCVCMYVCMHACMHACMHVCPSYVFTYSIHALFVCIHIFVYIYIHTHKRITNYMCMCTVHPLLPAIHHRFCFSKRVGKTM